MIFSKNRKSAVRKLRQLVFTSKSETESFRNKIEETFSSPILPNRVERSEHTYGETVCDILTPELYASHRVMLYIHGGSFVAGSRASWRPFCATIANVSSSRVVLPEIRLAPTHAFPAALEDIQGVFRSLYMEEEIACSLDTDENHPAIHPEIIVAGDGSGASQALAFLLSLEPRYRKSVSHVILLSPWLNLSPDSPIILDKKSSDEIMTGDCLRHCSEIYTYTTNLSNQLVSPLHADDRSLTDFPPVFIQMGEREILLADAKKFREKLEKQGTSCILDIWPGMMFMFQMADDYLPEAHLALDRIGRLITERKTEPDDMIASFKVEPEQGIKADA